MVGGSSCRRDRVLPWAQLGISFRASNASTWPARPPAAERAHALLEAEAEEAEKVLPRVMSFVVTPEQEELIEQAVELASDGTPGRDRKARGLANLARHYLRVNDGESAYS